MRTMLDREDREEGDDELPPLNEYALGATVTYAVRIELSTGGPADYLTALIDHGEVQRVVYHFADWFDHAERVLDGDEERTATEFIEATFGDLDTLGEMMRSDR